MAALGRLHVSFPGSEAPRLPIEHRVYRLRATLTFYKLESDEDVHLVLEEGGAEMIAEIPAPACTASATEHARSLMAAARSELERRVGQPTDSWQECGCPVDVLGVLFVDSNHGQRGVAPNAAELHPLLAFSAA